jgi:hypothetical protein
MMLLPLLLLEAFVQKCSFTTTVERKDETENVFSPRKP